MAARVWAKLVLPSSPLCDICNSSIVSVLACRALSEEVEIALKKAVNDAARSRN